MCGIAGMLGSGSAEELGRMLSRMIGTLVHRGPDDEGSWVDADSGVALGHRRLSIIDLSEAGHQPMQSPSSRYMMVFNGEIYNHRELRGLLEKEVQYLQAGEGIEWVWRGHSDTETLLACFDAWGIDKTLREVKGMFAIALWDRKLRLLTLIRDRFGEKPLYYGWQGGYFLFASELKAIRAHPAFNTSVDRGALALLLRHNYVPSPYSIYQGIHKLPPGALLRVSVGQNGTAPASWWSLGEVAEKGANSLFDGTEEEAVEALEAYLEAAVSSQMEADVPLGALLSGGLDSTAVVAMMQKQSNRPVHTFTVGFGEQEYDEATHARAVAGHLGTEHTELRLDAQEALNLIDRIPGIYDEPFADSSQLPTYLVMALARENVTVALSGDGGDEIFGGYNRYLFLGRVDRAVGWMPSGARRVLGRSMQALSARLSDRVLDNFTQKAGVSLPVQKLNKLGKGLQAMGDLDDFYVSLVSEWIDSEGLVKGGDVPVNLLDERQRWPALEDPIARMMAMDALTYLPDDILVKVDRAAMAVSLETRAPFLDRDLVEFAWSLPMHLKIRNGRGKWLLRCLLDRYVPREIMDRPKVGFGIPLDDWLRGPLRDWAETLLSKERLLHEGYLDPEPIHAAWHAHQAGRADNGYRLWSVLMFQSWLEAAA